MVERCEIEVASPAALVALKAVSIPRRSKGSYPEKIGSDIQDLYRLVEGRGLDRLTEDFASADPEVQRWVATFLVKTFSSGSSDLRYSLARLRRYTNNPDGREISEDDLALLGEVGSALSTQFEEYRRLRVAEEDLPDEER